MSTIEVKDVGFSYSAEPLLDGLSFSVESGAFLAIVGPNGTGKTTLVNLLAGVVEPQRGGIEIDSVDVADCSPCQLARKVAVVRQEFVPGFGFSVAQTVMMARTPYFGAFGFETDKDKEIVARALEATDTTRFASRRLGQISGGERQRVFIARALAQDTPIILLDEPTSFLDLKHQVGTFDLLKKMQIETNKTIITITHDVNLARQYCERILLLAGGGDYYEGLCEDILSVERIEGVFGVGGVGGRLGKAGFFLPLGRFARDRREIP